MSGFATMTRRQRLVLFLLLGSQFMLSVDFSILNVALPQVGTGVGIETSSLAWVVTAYALPAAGFTLLFGRIADLVGRRRLFLTGIAVLAVSSVLGGFADSPALLLTARTLQGLATAIATPAALSLLTTSFPEGPLRDRVLGLNGALLSGGFAAGALIGGVLVGALSWRWAFWLNVPVAVAILAITPFVVPAHRGQARARLDVPGAVSVTAGLLAFVFGVTNRMPAALVVGVALLGLFWVIELRARTPLAPVRILRRATVKWGNLGGLLALTMESGLIFLLTLYLQDVLHFSPLTTGLIFGIPGLASVAAGVVAGRIIGRFGAHRVLATGLLVQSLTAAPLLVLGADRIGLVVLIPSLFIGFFGHVTALVAYMVTATSGLPDSQQGLATGLATLTQQIGVTVGTPILGAIAAGQAVFLTGMHLAITMNVLVTVAGAALIWCRLRRLAARTENVTPIARTEPEPARAA
jgi:MFS family permease